MARQEQRTRILEAAEELFRRYGGKKTSMEDIAHKVGVSKPILYRHFASKDDLLLEVIDSMDLRHEQALRDLVAGVDGFEHKLRALTQFMIGNFKELSLDGAISVGLLRKLHERKMQGKPTMLRELISAGIEAGELRPVNVDLLQHGWHGAMIAVAVEAAKGGGVDEAFLGIREMNDILLQGLLKRP